MRSPSFPKSDSSNNALGQVLPRLAPREPTPSPRPNLYSHARSRVQPSKCLRAPPAFQPPPCRKLGNLHQAAQHSRRVPATSQYFLASPDDSTYSRSSPEPPPPARSTPATKCSENHPHSPARI